MGLIKDIEKEPSLQMKKQTCIYLLSNTKFYYILKWIHWGRLTHIIIYSVFVTQYLSLLQETC